jgi:hypothetical protein
LLRPRSVLAVQGAYYLATGTVPFVSRRAFEAVTGPKTDWWLVQTVSVVVDVVGASLISAAVRNRATPETLGLAAGCATALAAVDAVHVARGRIRRTYLLDAGIQAALVAALAAALPADGQQPPG